MGTAATRELKQLHSQVSPMGCLGVVCGGGEGNVPAMAIHRWYASLKNMSAGWSESWVSRSGYRSD